MRNLRFLLFIFSLIGAFAYGQPNLQILNATYGDGNNARDVTAAVAARIQGSGLRVQADPAMLGGDPAPGVVKQLRIRYSYNGVVADAIAQDGEWINIPLNTRGDTIGAVVRSRQNRDGQLKILSAQFGDGTKQADVTAMLAARIQNDALSMPVDVASMGVDPIMGTKKTLRVNYQWQGQAMETVVAEGAMLTLPNPQQAPIGTRDQVNIFDRITGRNPLKIVAAQYGTKDRFADVKTLLEQKIVNNGINLLVNNQTMGGDPAPATVKTLRVSYQWMGRNNDVVVQENATLAIPGSAATAAPAATAAQTASGGFFGGMVTNANQLRILSATYGSGNRTRDVTNLLNSKIQNNSLTITATNENLGADPAVGADKILQVSWTFNGKTQDSKVNEGKSLRIP